MPVAKKKSEKFTPPKLSNTPVVFADQAINVKSNVEEFSTNIETFEIPEPLNADLNGTLIPNVPTAVVVASPELTIVESVAGSALQLKVYVAAFVAGAAIVSATAAVPKTVLIVIVFSNMFLYERTQNLMTDTIHDTSLTQR